MKKISNEDKLIMVGYLGIALAYSILLVVKWNHLKQTK
tara:strand:- start:783 stop:896 length:114 start_codon:yes stop_codon:yes gene_type:complete